MSQVFPLSAELRDGAGKGVARRTRRAGRIPAVIYGNKEQPVLLSLDFNTFDKVLRTPGFFTHLFEVTAGGQTYRVLPRDVQLDPVTDAPIHIDFLRVTGGARVTVMVPCEFVNQDKSPGLRRGGVLNVVRHEIEFDCPAEAIPERIKVDLTGCDLGDSVHISAVTLPEGVKPTITDRDFTVVTIAAPSGLKAEAAEAAEGQEAAEGGEAE